MSRFLFVVPPLTGHTNPTLAVAAELDQRGHTVAWVAHPGQVKPLLPDHAKLYALDDSVPGSLVDSMTSQAQTVRGLAALKFLWSDFFLPLATAMVPGVEHAVDDFQPDVLIVDQQALAGALVARKRGLPWVTFATTSAGVTNPLAALPKVKAWLDDCFENLQRDAGLPPEPTLDASPHGVVVFSTAALVGGTGQYPDHFHFVGPSIRQRQDDTPFPWDALGDDPKVLVSLGTVNMDRGKRFFQTVIEALSGQPIQVVMVAPDDAVPNPPENFLVRSRVPQLALLPHLSAVVTHAGHNTVCESLAHGLPLVMAPIKDDQPVVAAQVADAGAGIRVKFGRLKPADLRAAVHAVLHEPAYRAAAQEIQTSFDHAGGETAVADLLARIIRVGRQQGRGELP